MSAPTVSLPLATVVIPVQALAVGLGVAGAAEADGALDGATEGAAVGVGAVVAALPVQAASSTAARVATLNKALRMTGSLMKL